MATSTKHLSGRIGPKKAAKAKRAASELTDFHGVSPGKESSAGPSPTMLPSRISAHRRNVNAPMPSSSETCCRLSPFGLFWHRPLPWKMADISRESAIVLYQFRVERMISVGTAFQPREPFHRGWKAAPTWSHQRRRGFPLVPKLQLGNAVSEAPASSGYGACRAGAWLTKAPKPELGNQRTFKSMPRNTSLSEMQHGGKGRR